MVTPIRYASVALAAIIVSALAVLALSAGDASAQSSEARIRVLHASPDAPAVDIYLDGAEAISDLDFDDITDYVAVPAGDHNVQIFPASADGSGEPVIQADVTLTASTDYTIAAVGALADIEPLVLVDNNAAPAAGQAHLRVVHASPDAPAVDVFAEGAGVVVPGAEFKDTSGYLPLGAGTYNLEVRAAGTETVAIDLPGVTLEAGNVYTAFAVGFLESSPAIGAKLTVDASYPQAAPTTTPHAVPSTGGPSADDGFAISMWLIAGFGLALVAGASVTFATVRNRNDR
ncbi:MAG TPA: DUF4397 domain-containing protein [Dehalococcoidia bacterium]|nr:DUF4397 domain-containing protein [Dehalococcoidia bacterium]